MKPTVAGEYPFCRTFGDQRAAHELAGMATEIVTFTQVIYRLPKSIDAVMSQAQQGNLTVKNSIAPESRRLPVRLERSINKLSWAIGSVGLLIAGVTVKERGYRELAVDRACCTGNTLFGLGNPGGIGAGDFLDKATRIESQKLNRFLTYLECHIRSHHKRSIYTVQSRGMLSDNQEKTAFLT